MMSCMRHHIVEGMRSLADRKLGYRCGKPLPESLIAHSSRTQTSAYNTVGNANCLMSTSRDCTGGAG